MSTALLEVLAQNSAKSDRSGVLSRASREALAEISATLVSEARRRDKFSAPETNDVLALVAKADLSSAALLWRQLSNAHRLLLYGDAHGPLLDELERGAVITSAFSAHKATATKIDGQWRVRGEGLICTGLPYASSVLIEARTAIASTIFALHAEQVRIITRPSFHGLRAAATVVIGVDTIVPAQAMIGAEDGANDVVESAYRHGLCFGALAAGAAASVVEIVQDHLGDCSHDPEETDRLARLAVEVAAATAMVASAGKHAPNASVWTRAAKLYATGVALAACRRARALLGTATYYETHPLNQLERDARSLELMAPTDRGAISCIASALRDRCASFNPSRPEPPEKRG